MKKRKLTLTPMSIFSLVRELRRGTGDPRPLAVAGARELVPLLARELRAGGDAGAVVEGRFEDAAVLIWIGAPDEDALRDASRRGVPIIAVTEAETVPYVLAHGSRSRAARRGFPRRGDRRAPSHGVSARTALRSQPGFRRCAARSARS